MWWSIVIAQRNRPPEEGINLGSWNGAAMGDRAAKKAAKAAGRDYIQHGGPGQPRLVKSPMKLPGSLDMTSGVAGLSDEAPDEALDPVESADFEHVLSGRDAFEGSPFYGDQPDEVLKEMELLFRDSGWAVVGYLCGLDKTDDNPGARVAGLMGFGGVTAQAEFWAYCRRRSRDATEEWLTERYDAMLGAFTRSSSIPQEEAAALIKEARSMIERSWEQVMALATAKLASSMDVDGREIKFLRDIYGDPDQLDDA